MARRPSIGRRKQEGMGIGERVMPLPPRDIVVGHTLHNELLEESSRSVKISIIVEWVRWVASMYFKRMDP